MNAAIRADAVEAQWDVYVRPRFAEAEKATRARRAFEADITAIFDHLVAQAVRYGREVDYGRNYLALLALQSLDAPCAYCGQLYGLGNFGFDQIWPACRRGWFTHRASNLQVCCARCAQAKDGMSEPEWLAVMQALKIADERAVERFLDALVRGRGPCEASGRCARGEDRR